MVFEINQIISSLMVILFSGFIQGCLYSLASVGLTLQWGTARTLSFAHGALITWGAYLVWGSLNNPMFRLGYGEGFFLMILITFLVGIALDRLVLSTFRRKPGTDINIFISTLGVATILENVALITFGGRLKQLPPIVSGSMEFGPIHASWHRILIGVVALSSLIALLLFLKKTRSGMAIQAVAQDMEAASLMGINVKMVYTITIAVGMVLAGIAGALLGSILFITPTMGNVPLLKAFFVVVLGGLGSVKGTTYAAFIIGEIEALAMYFLGVFWASPVLFTLMIALLLIRPEGLYGEKIS